MSFSTLTQDILDFEEAMEGPGADMVVPVGGWCEA